MADAGLGEARQLNLHTAGTDMVEISSIAVQSATGAQFVAGFLETSFYSIAVGGAIAHDAIDAGNPIKIGGYAKLAAPTAVSADADRVAAWFGLNGQQAVELVSSTGVIQEITTNVSDAQARTGLWAHADLLGFNGTNMDRLRTIDALSTAPNVTTGIAAVGVGPGYDRKFNPANLGTAVNSAITNTTDGADIAIFDIRTSTTGTFTFEVSPDDTNWVAADVVNAQTGVIQTANITPTTGQIWRVSAGGWRQVRIRTVALLGATVAVKQTFHLGRFIPNTWRELTNARAADMAIVDGAGNQITSFGSPAKPTVGTQTIVAASATSVTVLASNANRLGASITNDSTAILYLLVGAGTASTTVYTVKLSAGAYYEVPFSYTGIIVGIWSSATGSARVMEWT